MEEHWSSAYFFRNFPRQKKVLSVWPTMHILCFYFVGQSCADGKWWQLWKLNYYIIWNFYLLPLILILTGLYFLIRPSAYYVASCYPNVTWCQSTRVPKTHAPQLGHQICERAWWCLLRLLPYFCNKIGHFFLHFQAKSFILYNNNNIGLVFFMWYENIPHSSWKYCTRPMDSCGILMTHAVYSRITLKAIQYYITIPLFPYLSVRLDGRNLSSNSA